MYSEQLMSRVLSKAAANYRVETAGSVDTEDLIDFFKRAYSDQFNAGSYHDRARILKRWEWANLNNPNIYDREFPSWVCKDNREGKIVGHFGIMPVSLKVKNLLYPAAWSRDLIVLPELRAFA